MTHALIALAAATAARVMLPRPNVALIVANSLRDGAPAGVGHALARRNLT